MNTKPQSQPQAAEWWSSLDEPWQAIFKAAIGIKTEPTEKELVTILNLTKLDCHHKKLTSLEPLLALTGLQTLDCGWNQLTCLEPLHGLSLKTLVYENNPSLSQPELERLLTNNKRCWWTSLGWQWQAIFREAIGIKSEPTETKLKEVWVTLNQDLPLLKLAILHLLENSAK